MNKLYIKNNTPFYNCILHYIYKNYSEKVKDFEYLSEDIIKSYEYRPRRYEDKIKVKTLVPIDTKFSFIYKKEEQEYSRGSAETGCRVVCCH